MKKLVPLLLLSPMAFADPMMDALNDHATSQLLPLSSNAVIIDAIKAQNAKNANISQDEINTLDKTWRAEVGAGNQPLISKTLGNDLSAHLVSVQEQSDGLYTEIFVMDMKGLNVGQSAVTSDYWQGDEAKFQDTYGKGPNSVLVGEIEEDESTQTFQSQVSLAITDPSTGKVIGAITYGINVDELE
ncbi:hypothetical protein N9R79_08780 [Vibrio sp.]|nr:hypothetical protein [Vibrio sp.]